MKRSTIRRGSKGEDVKVWQAVINVSADGDFGPKTEAATIVWQSSHGLRADGVVGPATWAAASEPDVYQRPLEPVPAKKTPVTPAEMYAALRSAWVAKFGAEPSRASLLVLLAQSGIETADWRSMWNYNVGNVKRGKGQPWTMLPHVWEIIRGERVVFEPPHPQTHFRAFPDLEAGAAAYLDTMAGRFAKSWEAVVSGDPEAFARALKAQHYYTAPVDAYAKALAARFRAFNLSIPIDG